MRVKLDPIAEPVTTIGASNPAEPPKPTVKALVNMFEYILVLRMMEDLLEMA